MSPLNPYSHFLTDRDPLKTISATPKRLASLSKKLSKTAAERHPAPGKWNARQIVCHLADTEISFAFRLRQTLAEKDHIIQPFDQDHWAWPYDRLKLADALAAFTAFRAWNLRLLENVKGAQWNRPVTHPERGKMTLRTIVETMGGHDLNHLTQIEALRKLPSARR
jgi:hypothetical protein